MKICPNCRKTYADDNLNFCLDDGSVLTVAQSSEPAPTVMMSQPRPTDYHLQGTAPQFNPQIQSSFGNDPQYAVPPKKKSKTWLWAVGVLGILLLLCGGGGVLGLVYLASIAEPPKNNSNIAIATNTNANANTKKTANANTFPGPSPAAGEADTVDLSTWVEDSQAWGLTEMVGDEFVMAAKQKGYYYVLVASTGFITDGAKTSVTVRNVDNANSSLGYGLVFHSATKPLTKDYAFLIDAKRKKYRVARHEPSDEITMIPWTNSNAIKEGTLENILEAHDKGDTIELYINGQMVNSIKDQYGQPNGVPGIYSGDAAKIGFKKLEIRK